jgi:alpha-galactosidase
MRLVLDRIELPGSGTVPLSRPPTPADGTEGFALGLTPSGSWLMHGSSEGIETESWSWWLARDDARVEPLRSALLIFRVVDVSGRVRMLRHGYQSWSPCDVVAFGETRDRSLAPGSVELIRAINQADQRVVEFPDELRSEWVTVLVDETNEPVLVGFDGGDRHDGTLRLRTGPTGVELCCEAFMGDVVLSEGERRELHHVLIAQGQTADHLLAAWADVVGSRGSARVSAGHQVGWCSWYHYFHDVTQDDITANLQRADDWPFDVFQVDDGFQSAIGDWLTTNEKFPAGLEALASSIASRGRRPGLWLAPFLCAPDSVIAHEHPEWLARGFDGEPLLNMFNAPWGGGRDGLMYGLDTTLPEVQEHLRSLAATVVAMGYTYLKLDFTFSPSFDGVWSDRSLTPAQRVRAGFEAIRAGAGNDTFLLGCGVPLAHSVGIVDGNRIGADVAPAWSLSSDAPMLSGYAGTQPATRHAWAATATRSFMHRRLWLNDPDCVMLRSEQTDLSIAAAQTWARAVGVSGGMVLVSDDLALLGESARSLLNESIELSQRADVAAQAGNVASAPDLLGGEEPTKLRSAVGELHVQLDDGSSVFSLIG